MFALHVTALMLCSLAPAEMMVFTAPWCGACKKLAPAVAEVEAAGYPIHRINCDQQADLAKQYKIDTIPTVVLLVDGKEVARTVGPARARELLAMFREAGIAPREPAAIASGVRAQNPETKRPLLSGLNRVMSKGPGKLFGRKNAAAADRFQAESTAPPFESEGVEVTLPDVQPAPTRSPAVFAEHAERTVESAAAAAPPGTALTASNAPLAGNATLAAAPLAAAEAPTAPAAPPAASPGRRVPTQELIDCSVRLNVEDDKGNSHGSGTIIDARGNDALVLTCAHLFRESAGKGKIKVDLFFAGAPQGLPGKLLSYDLKRDVALVAIRPGMRVKAARLIPQGRKLQVGDRLISVGCGNGADPTAQAGQVTAVNRFLGPANVEVSGVPVEGRSGGGLFTPEGEVVGVCNAADPSLGEGMYAAADTIFEQLDDAKLSVIYRASTSPVVLAAATEPLPSTSVPAPSMPAQMPEADWNASSEGSVAVAGLEELSAAGAAPVEPADSAALAPLAAAGPAAGLTAAEQAMVAGLQQQAGDGAEVICIVRTHDDPRGKSEIVVLDHASPDFLKQLTAERRAQGSRRLTKLRDPRLPAAGSQP